MVLTGFLENVAAPHEQCTALDLLVLIEWENRSQSDSKIQRGLSKIEQIVRPSTGRIKNLRNILCSGSPFLMSNYGDQPIIPTYNSS